MVKARTIPETVTILMKARIFMNHMTVAEAGFEPQERSPHRYPFP
jgi:hypothetical protein